MLPSMSIEAFTSMLEVRLDRVFTEEQTKFIQSLDRPGICFASPGTGKTASAVAGLLLTELYKGIPGDNIYALSFTNMATLELSVRHEEACKLLGVSQRVHFKTLHAMCSKILRDHYTSIGMWKYETIKEWDMESMAKTIYDSARSMNIDLDAHKARTVVRAVRALNSSLTFARENVTTKASFIDTGLSYDDFQYLRKLMYEYDKQVGTVESNNIMIYTLELLLEHPEISEEFKKDCKVLLVDEAQDLSLLQLRILSLLTDNLILIGDIKQQIYAFNGACQEIVTQYKRYFPQAWTLEFTKSFRCKNEIVNYATKLILPNKVGGENFIGTGDGGIVTIEKGIDYKTICEKINDDFLSNRRNFTKGILFLFRNNLSSIPIAEEFYKLGTPFRINHYKPVSQITVMRELCAIADLAENPRGTEYLYALKYLIPELRVYNNIQESPIFKIMKSKRCDLFDVDYKYRDTYCAENVMHMLMEVNEMLLHGDSAAAVFNKIYPLLYEYWFKTRERFMEYDANYYLNLAAYVVRGKSYRQFRQDELKKSEMIKDCNERRIGVRCFTFHSAKGLEDDIVYMVDCDQGIIPNKSKMKSMTDRHCLMDAAREVRNERSLVYVAATRAKTELHIHYNEELSSIMTSVNEYSNLDFIYENYKQSYSDVEVFQDFYRREV